MNHLQFQVGIGTIALTWDSRGLLSCIDWYFTGTTSATPVGRWFAMSKVEIPDTVGRLVERLEHYFSQGEPIGDVPWDSLNVRDLSEFQQLVYRALVEIPHGETRTYSWLAKRVGNPQATRAVGQALRKNPFPVLIPCHRVVAVQAVGGFMGISDPHRPEVIFKQKLIELENKYRNPMFSFLSWDCEKGSGGPFEAVPAAT